MGALMLKGLRIIFAATLACIVGVGGVSTATGAADLNFTTLPVNGEAVTIFRDEFGVPHIFAETNRGLFEAFGYTAAQDRLWQLELNRRSARGRLAEVFGAGSVAVDQMALRFGYTDAELDVQFASLNPEEQEIFTAYADGINRYLDEIVAPDQAHRLPFEFHFLNLGVPGHWTVRDLVALNAFMWRIFFDFGGGERINLGLLNNL